MPNDHTILLRYERHGQLPDVVQRIYNELLRVVSVRGVQEYRDVHGFDRIDVSDGFLADPDINHERAITVKIIRNNPANSRIDPLLSYKSSSKTITDEPSL